MRSGLLLALVSVGSLGACAKADKIAITVGGGDHPDGGGGIVRPDSGSGSSGPRIDAFVPPDAPPGVMQKTLTQTTTDTITPNNSVECAPKTAGHGTLDNSFYRVFDLADFGIAGDFTVDHMTFQVEDDFNVDTDDVFVDVAVGTYSGSVGDTLSGTLNSLATSESVDVPEIDEGAGDDPATINVPLAATIPAGSKVYVQVHSYGGRDLEEFFIGTTDTGESGKSYVSSLDCSPPGDTPTSVASLVDDPTVNSDLLITVTGTY